MNELVAKPDALAQFLCCDGKHLAGGEGGGKTKTVGQYVQLGVPDCKANCTCISTGIHDAREGQQLTKAGGRGQVPRSSLPVSYWPFPRWHKAHAISFLG